jgi:hypothetical protein
LIEGGNVIAATNKSGVSGVIVGEASLVQSCLRMARTGLLPQDKVAEKRKKSSKRASPTNRNTK